MVPDLSTIARKVKSLRHLDTNRMAEEVASLELMLRERTEAVRNYRPHPVEVENVRYLACDAKMLNKHAHQSGRGDFRYLFRDLTYVGVAVHTNSGAYAVVA